MPRSPFVLLFLVLALGAAAPARAQDEIPAAAAALQSDPVYVSPDADPGLSAAEADALRQRIQESGAAPMYVAVLAPGAENTTGGDLQETLQRLIGDVRGDGSYILVSGRKLRTASNRVEITGLTREVLREDQGAALPDVLGDLVDRVGEERAGGSSSSGGGDGGGFGGAGLIIFGGLAVGAGGVALAAKRRRRREEEAELEEIKANVRDDLVALGDDIRALDIDMELKGTPAEAKDAYAAALAAYERAETTWERARHPDDLEPVGAALEEGRWAMLSAKALVAGQRPPERRPPCFFDPRHGPSSRDVEWAPPYGEPRLVPACEADAQRVERGDDPHARELVVQGQRVPYWEAGPGYAPFAGGFFGGFGGGLLPGLLVGSMLGGGFGGFGFPGAAYGDAGGWDGGWGGGDGGGGFSFGGGDFGGGGGGDFGGGGGDF
ncbi:MAG TPA: hypothetical protein VF533_07980 [Solirubrobacteraceae bacterium]|jgi:hypothetical protein